MQRLACLLVMGISVVAGPVAADEPAPLADEAPPMDGETLLERAWRAQRAGQPREAEADLRAALALFEETGDSRGERLALVNLALLQADLDRADEAADLLRRAVGLADTSVDRSAPVATRALLADVLVDAQRPLDALAWADAALVAAAAVEHPEYFPAAIVAYLRTSLAVDGSTASLVGAVEHVERRLGGEPGYEGSQSIPQIAFSHGVGELGQGDARAALEAMDIAVAVADALGIEDGLPVFLAGLGFVGLQAGDEARARGALERGLAIEPDVPLLATLAHLEWREGWVDRAIQRYAEALDLAQQQGIGDEATELRIALADLHAAIGELDTARQLHERSLDDLVRAGDEDSALVQRARLALVDARLGRWAEARRQAERSLSVNRDSFERPGGSPTYLAPRAAADALMVLAAVYWERGEPRDAEAALAQVLEILAAPGADRSVAVASFGHVALRQGKTEQASKRFEEVDGAPPDWRLAHGRGLTLWRMGDLVGAEAALRDSLAALEDEPLERATGWAPFVPSPGTVRGDLVALLRQQEREQDALNVVLSAEGRSADELMPGPDSALLVYGATSDEGVLWVVDGGELQAFSLGRSMVEIERQVLDYVEVVSEEPVAGRKPSEAWVEPSRELYDRLLRPADGLLAGKKELVVVPLGVIARVPFATLLDGDEPLVARYRLTMLGPPQATGSWTLPRRPVVSVLLPEEDGAMTESDAIRASFRRATELEPRSAAEVLAQLQTAHLVHLSVVVESNPLQPERTLVMASRDPDGRLTTGEIGGHEVGAALVVLAGCRSGPPLGLANDLASLRPRPFLPVLAGALLGAGATRVLASQWSPPPQGRAELLRGIYRDLGRHGPTESLRRAQARMAGSGVHPYYWGGWIVFGGVRESVL